MLRNLKRCCTRRINFGERQRQTLIHLCLSCIFNFFLFFFFFFPWPGKRLSHLTCQHLADRCTVKCMKGHNILMMMHVSNLTNAVNTSQYMCYFFVPCGESHPDSLERVRSFVSCRVERNSINSVAN